MNLSRSKAILCLVSILAGSLNVTGQNSSGTEISALLQPALESIQGEKLLTYIKTPASDEFEGRALRTIGETKTVGYLVEQFKRSGFKPGNSDGTYIQEVPRVGFQTRPQIELSVKGANVPLNYPEDFVHETPRLFPQISLKNLGVVFAGYGIVAPEYGWDDYKKIDILYPLAKSVANINLDACNVCGKTKDLASTGYGNSTLDEILEKAANLQGRTFTKGSLDNGGLYFGSDQIEFAKAGIPADFPWSGFEYIDKPADFGDKKWGKCGEKDYHQVTDEVEADWDLSGGAEDARWLITAGYLVAQSQERPKWSNDSEFRNLRPSK